MSSSITVTATKPHDDAKLGIGLLTNEDNGEVYISSIKPDGIFASTLLQQGMVIDDVNGNNCKGLHSSQMVSMLKEAKAGDITITAHQTTSTSGLVQATAVLPSGSGVPPGAPVGGMWGTNTYSGNSTQAAACLGCLCCGCLACLIHLCPIDERDAYKAPNGKVSFGGESADLQTLFTYFVAMYKIQLVMFDFNLGLPSRWKTCSR